MIATKTSTVTMAMPARAIRLRSARPHARLLFVAVEAPGANGVVPGAARVFISHVSDPRIGEEVQEVAGEISHADEEGSEERQAHDHGVVTVVDAGDEVMAESGDPEDAFHEERPR